MKTLFDAVAAVERWMPGEGRSIDAGVKKDAVNDAIESIWQSLMRATLSQFIGGPVTLTVDAADERIAINSVADPTVAPSISQTTVGALAEHTIYSCYTFVTESGSETLPSSTDTTVIAINKVATMASPSYASGALGWNCYMGTASTRMSKQNINPTPFGTGFSEPLSGASNQPDSGGVPTVNTTSDDLFAIRRIEAPGPLTGTYQRWEGADLDSMMMTQAAMSVGAASAYQAYVWDLLNGNSLEIRPAAAAAVTGRYFYVKRPRRLAFDSSPIPFTNMPVSEFIRCYSLGLVFTMLREWESVKAYDAKAASARSLLVKSVQQQDAPKNQRITPFMYA